MFGFWKGTKAKLLPSTGIEFSDGRIKTYASGSPEGVITATVGSEYTDTSSGILYQKRSGSGNTGWVSTVALTEMATGSMSAPGLPFVGDANTGIFQPNVNRLGITTDGQERFMVDENGRLYNVYDSDQGTNYRTTLHSGWLARGWFNFNGTGTPAFRAAGNFTSIADNGTGAYSLNMLASLPDTNYGVVVFSSENATVPTLPQRCSGYDYGNWTTSQFKIYNTREDNSAFDSVAIMGAVFR